MSEKKFPPPSEADPCPCPLPQPNRRADDFQADLVEGDEGGGSSGLGNKERRSGHRSLKNTTWNQRRPV